MKIDMTPAAVEARLTRCAELSATQPVVRVDMSPRAIEARLQDCAEMSTLCAELGAELGERSPVV